MTPIPLPLPELQVRSDWTTAEIQALLELPLMDLLWRAQTVHRQANPGYRVQLASLLSVKTGGCEEDCAYCPQSMHNSSDVTGRPELEVEPVLARARAAKDAGAHRFCMGWAWRDIRDGAPFEAMLAMVRGVRELGMEACVTAGMLTDSQAERLAEAGLTPTTTTSIPAPSTTTGSSPPAPSRNGWKPFSGCARLESRCAAAASSVWAKPSPIAPRCCRCSRR